MNHKEKYATLLELIGESFPNEYYKRYLPDLVIQQKPGYVAEALNVEAIVYEQTPYLISIFTAGLGGTTPEKYRDQWLRSSFTWSTLLCDQ